MCSKYTVHYSIAILKIHNNIQINIVIINYK